MKKQYISLIILLIILIGSMLIINLSKSNDDVSAQLKQTEKIIASVKSYYDANRQSIILPTTLEINLEGIIVNDDIITIEGEKPISGTIVIDSEGLVSVQNLTYSDGFICTMGEDEEGCIQNKITLPNMIDDPNIDGRKIFKGANPNNYINILEDNEKVKYRIISIEKDGTIKVVRNESITNIQYDSISKDRNNDQNTYCASEPYYGCNAFMKVGLNYHNENIIGTVSEDSEMKVYLNTNFYSKLSDKIKTKIVTHNFNLKDANYNSANGIGTSIKNLLGQDNTNWTGRIGLIEIRDYFLSTSNECDPSIGGGYYQEEIDDSNNYACGLNNYLYNGNTFFTMTPISSNNNNIFVVHKNGFISNSGVSYNADVRPTFYLSNSVKLKGDGTLESPFEIKF